MDFVFVGAVQLDLQGGVVVGPMMCLEEWVRLKSNCMQALGKLWPRTEVYF